MGVARTLAFPTDENTGANGVPTGPIFHPLPSTGAAPAGTVRLDALEVEDWERKIKGMLFQRGEADKEIASLRKELDAFADRFRSLEENNRSTLKTLAALQAKYTLTEERWQQAVRDKAALVAETAAAKSDLKQTRLRLERLELEVMEKEHRGGFRGRRQRGGGARGSRGPCHAHALSRSKHGPALGVGDGRSQLQKEKLGSSFVASGGTMDKDATLVPRQNAQMSREVAQMRRELQKRESEVEMLDSLRRELAARTTELEDARGRNHLLQAEIREVRSQTLLQARRAPSEQLQAQLAHQLKLTAALQHELEDLRQGRVTAAPSATRADPGAVMALEAQLASKDAELAQVTAQHAAQLACQVDKSAALAAHMAQKDAALAQATAAHAAILAQKDQELVRLRSQIAQAQVVPGAGPAAAPATPTATRTPAPKPLATAAGSKASAAAAATPTPARTVTTPALKPVATPIRPTPESTRSLTQQLAAAQVRECAFMDERVHAIAKLATLASAQRARAGQRPRAQLVTHVRIWRARAMGGDRLAASNQGTGRTDPEAAGGAGDARRESARGRGARGRTFCDSDGL